MAIPATTILQFNASAAVDLGGGFNPANANFLTNYTATLATSAAPLLSSASYTFVAGDIGHWVYVQTVGASANWTQGFYKISDVILGVATLDATIGNAVQFIGGRWKANTVQGCATGASPTGGVIGIDYSQHSSGTVGFALTTANSAGAGAVVNHASAAVNWPGNCIYVVSGTGLTSGSTVGRFEIISVVAGVSFTCGTNQAGTNVGTGAGASDGVINIGGSLSVVIDAIFEIGVTGNAGLLYFVKAGTYSFPSNVMNQAGNGTTAIHHKIEGFNTIRGDRPNIVNGLARPEWIVTNIAAGQYWDYRNIIISGTGASACTLYTNAIVIDCKFINTSTSATRNAFQPGAVGVFLYRCEMVSYRGPGIQSGNVSSTYMNCYIHDSTYGVYINATVATMHFINCIIESNVVGAIHYVTGLNTTPCIFDGCTLYGSENKTGVGFNLPTGVRSINLRNCIIYGFVTGASAVDSLQTPLAAGQSYNSNYNCFYNNTTDRTNWPIGEGDSALVPGFASVSQVTGTIATTGSSTLVDATKDFIAAGVVAGRDAVYIVSGTGVTVGIYGITNVATTTLTLDSTAGTNATADKVYQITIGRNFAIGTNLKALAAPNKFPGGYTSSYVDIGAAQRQETVSTDPGSTNVKTAVGYTFEGTSLTGSYTGADRWSDPGSANVLSGTSYLVNAVTTTGTLPSGLTYTDPGIAQVLLGTSYIYASVTLTGSLVVPTAASGTAGSVDISNIKEQIRFVLNAANTTTGSPIDLSNNLTTRVKQVMKINPEKIRVDVNSYPCVTVFTNKKTIELKTIAKDQVTGKRKCELIFTIVGIIWNDLTADYKEDGADEDVEILMENIEVVLRSFANLSSTVTWQFPTGVQYHSVPYSEDTHMRVGVMDLQATIYY